MSVFRRRLIGASRKGSGIDMPNYMTIEALEDGLTASLSRSACEYSIDGGEWVSLAAGAYTPAVNAGHIISFKANNPTVSSNNGIGTFTITKRCNLKGNCMSLVGYDDAASVTSVKQYGLAVLFKGCTSIINVEKGFLPATSFSGSYSYYRMFYGCSNLATAPDLPATTIKSYCYYQMFYDCTNLRQAPTLPANTAQGRCYYEMFYNCSSLSVVPTLPATTLNTSCYYGMFRGCSSLEVVPELPARNTMANCYQYMFAGCTSLKSTPSMSINGDMGTNCCREMFSGCTNLTSINMTISASYFSDYCCYGMFSRCTKLVNASFLFNTDSNAVLDTNCFAYMFRGCTNLVGAPSLPSLNLAAACYSDMFSNCSSLVNVPELPATTLALSCYARMFYYCTQIVYASLPALELVEDCYGQMFFGCERLSELKAMFLTTPSTTYTNQWVYGVDSFGRFTKNANATWNVTGENGIPNTWTVVTVIGGGNVNINLNGQWAKNDSISPDTSLYDAYESVSNVGVNSSEATMYITINGLSSFRLYLRSNAESSYDYAMVSQLNAAINGNTETTSSNVRADTKGNQQSGTSLSSYLIVDYDNIPSGDNVITVVYRKDSTQSSGTDKAYVLIPK